MECQQCLAAGRSHRSEISKSEAGAAEQLPGKLPVGKSQRPGKSCGIDRTAAPDHQIRRAVNEGGHNTIQLLRVEAGIRVHHHHDWSGRGQQACMACCAVSLL